MIRFFFSAVAAIFTLIATLFLLSKAVAPAASGFQAIVGRLDLFGPSQSPAPRDELWCTKQPNATLELAESFRELCDAARDDCGSDCVRVTTNEWAPDCSSHTATTVCVPSNPLLKAN